MKYIDVYIEKHAEVYRYLEYLRNCYRSSI